ncbi:MAG: RidA family protein [Acidimicrobiales bacterium]
MSPQRPYSLWRRAGDFIILSGQLGNVPNADTMTLVDGGTVEELRQALANAQRILAEAGSDLSHVVKTTLYVLTMEEFGACNEVWLETFSEPLPTRTAVAVAQLPYGAHVEVELWALA